MTRLCELILECRAIEGVDRFILYGWAAQLEEGNDTVFASKETVADFLGVSPNTVRRRTKALIAAGWLIDTGEGKQWQLARTPVRVINVPMLVGKDDAKPVQTAPHQIDAVNNPTKTGLVGAPHQIAPHQIDAQGSYGSSSSLGLSRFSFSTLDVSAATGVPPVMVEAPNKSKESKESKEARTLKPENLEPKPRRFPPMATFPEPEPEPKPQMAIDKSKGLAGSKRVCKDCGEPLLRGVNHLLVCKGVGLPPTQIGETDGKNRESIVVEEKTPPTATPDVAPRAAAPPASSWCPRCGVSGGKHANEPPDLVCPVLKANGAKASIPCIACNKAPRRHPTSDYCQGCWDLRQPPKPERRGNDVGMPPQELIPQPAWVDDVFD
jgi:hypothetical protein